MYVLSTAIFSSCIIVFVWLVRNKQATWAGTCALSKSRLACLSQVRTWQHCHH